jgi:BMFP domain-containing protein YqiC
MTDQQLYLAIGIPILFNGVALTVISTLQSSRMTDLATSLRRELDVQFKVVLGKLEELEARISRLETQR